MTDNTVRIWQAFGPNHSDDSRSPDPLIGVYQGEKDTVVDWITLFHPDFREHLEGRKSPEARLVEVQPKVVTREMVTELKSAQEDFIRVRTRLETAMG